MKATWHGHVIAESDETIELDGYRYFPPASVRMEFLQLAPKTGGRPSLPSQCAVFHSCGWNPPERAGGVGVPGSARLICPCGSMGWVLERRRAATLTELRAAQAGTSASSAVMQRIDSTMR